MGSRAVKPAVAESPLPLSSHPLNIQVTLNPPSALAAPATGPLLTLLCFDKAFDSDRDAEVWSMEVRASLREKLDHYLLRRAKAHSIKFMVCLGPFKNTEEAEKKRPTLADALQTPLFAEEIENVLAQ